MHRTALLGATPARHHHRQQMLILLLCTFYALCHPPAWAGTWTIGVADGSFEAGLDGMTTAGDVRLLSSLGSLYPSQGQQAVLLTTAPNAGAERLHADLSVLRFAPMSIPADTPQLRLDYVFLSNERTPSYTNDRFTVTLALIAGGEETLLQVDTFDLPYPAPWTGYARQTGFRTLLADLSAYAGSGETVSLELHIRDVGDGRGDSAVWLDNVQFTAATEPVACVSSVYQVLQSGDTLFADGSCSTDSDDLIVEYRWNLGDGTERIGRFIEHTYASDGIYQGTLTVKDLTGNRSSISFHTVVGDTNHAPQIVSPPVLLAANHTPYRYDVRTADPEVIFGDTLRFSLTAAPPGMVIDPSTGAITWTPGTSDARQHPVTVTVTDSRGLSSSQSFTLTVDAEVYIVASDDLGRLYAARSNGDGTFADYRFVADIGQNTRGAVLADFDRDGDFDLLSGSAQGDTLTLYYLEKQGTQLSEPVAIATLGDNSTPVGDFAMDMASGDFNSDGNPDVVLNGNGPHSWLLINQGQPGADGAPVFAISLLPGTTGNGRGLDAADVNGDGQIDIARGRCCDGMVELYLGDGTGQFSAGTPVAAGSDPYGLVLADVDRDGLPDLLVQSGGADAQFFRGNGDGSFQPGLSIPSIDTNNVSSFAAFDFNRDGTPDLVSTDFTSKQVGFHAGNGDGTFAARTLIGVTAGDTLGIAAPAGRVPGQPVSLIVVDADTVAAGGTVAFDASSSYDDGTIINYHWDFGDGSTASGISVSHLYSSEGIYQVVLTITDDAGNLDRRSQRIVVRGTPPVANAGGPYAVSEADASGGKWPVALDGSASSDAETGIASYSWDIDASDGIGTDVTGPAPRYAYSAPGVYTVTLTVTDGAGQTNTATASVTVTAGATPVAAISGPAVLDESVASLGSWTLRADVGGSSDDVAIASYTIDWGDGTQTVISSLRDHFEDGDLDTNPAWTANGGNWTIVNGELHQDDTSSGWKWLQNLSTSYRDFTLELDVNGVSSGGQIGIAFHNANQPGSQDTFLLSSADADNTWHLTEWSSNTVLATGGSGWDAGIRYHLRLVVSGNTMQLFATPEGGAETLQLEATDPRHPSGGIALLANAQHVIFDNIEVTPTGDSLQAMHTYNAAGTYTVSLSATDHAAQSASAGLNVSVTANAPPVADAGGPYVLTEADAYGGAWSFSLDASATSDDHGVQRHTIDFGDGTVYTTGFSSGTRGSYFASGTDLYGYSVSSTSVSRIIASEDNTNVQVIDLSDKHLIATTTLNRFATWEVTPGAGVAFKIKASKPVVALLTDGSSHSAFVPSLDSSPVGHEFLFQHQAGENFLVYAIEDALVRVFDSSNLLVAEHPMRVASVWQPTNLSDTTYHVIASGRVAMQSTGNTGYTTVPATSGAAVGRQFYVATSAGTSGAFAVFAYEAADLEVFDLETGTSLYTHSLTPGTFWLQSGVGTRRLRLESSGDVEVWAGDLEGGTGIVNLGDDISLTTGRGGTEFVLHSLQDGFVIFAPNGATVSIDGGALGNTLARDGSWRLTPADLPGGTGLYQVSATRPILIQSLGQANGYNDIGTYLGGVSARHTYSAPGLYTVTLSATDHAGQTRATTTTVKVQAGDPPLASISAPALVDETFASGGQWAVNFDANGSSDDHGIFSYAWDFGDGTSGSGVSPTHLYGAAGTYSVTLTVTDHAGQQSSTTFSVDVTAGSPPVANAGGPYLFGEEFANIGVWTATVDAGASSDDAGIDAYEWWLSFSDDFSGTRIDNNIWQASPGVSQDDTITVTGASPWGQRYLFSQAAHYRIFQARVRPVNLTGYQFGMWGMRRADATTFSYTSMPYAIYFHGSDLQVYEDGALRGSFASYTRGDLYDIRITVKAGGSGAVYEFKRAEDTDWTLLYDSDYLSSVPLQVGGTVVSGTFVIDNVQRTEVYDGPTLTQTFSSPGVHALTLKVWDNALQPASDTTTVTIAAGSPPVADAGGPYILPDDRLVAFSSAAASDDAGIMRYHWDFGDGTATINPNPLHLYATPDTYTATLTVTDHALQTSSATTTVQPARVSQVSRAGLSGDWQTLEVGGTLSAQIDNRDATDMGPFSVTFFEDIDGNGRFDATVDTTLGSVSHESLAAGAALQVSAAASGTLRFRQPVISAFLDSGAAGDSSDVSHYGDSRQACTRVPPVGQFNPVLEWQWAGDAVNADSDGVIMAPAVIDLTADGIPDVVFASVTGIQFSAGLLRAINGADGSPLFTVTDPGVYGIGQLAVGDIDLDGRPEIVAVDRPGTGLIAFEHDGTFKWQSPELSEQISWGAPAIADLDHDGTPEIVAGASVFNADGTLRWTGSPGRGEHPNGLGPLSLVADLDLQGGAEVVAGNTAYYADGTVYWHNANLGDGFNAVGNFDLDPFPEIVLVSNGKVYLLEHDGSVKWGPIILSGGGDGGAPTVADMDGDGEPEIGIANASTYTVLETDGTLKWSQPIQDGSSSVTGSSVFDFEGDGRAEVVYGDETTLRIFRGSDGTVLWSAPSLSSTGYELPVIVDVDGDGQAEIIKVSDYAAQGAGIQVFGDANQSWVGTRKLWNQHTYHVTNINDDGSIPPHETPSWQTHNSYRRNLLTVGDALRFADLTASFVRIDVQGGQAQVTARIGNGGAFAAPAGVAVAFYDGDPDTGGMLLGMASTTTELAPNAYEDVPLIVSTETADPVWVVVDGNDRVAECDDANNSHNSGLPVQLNQPPLADAGGPYSAQEGIALTLDGSGSSDADGDALTYAWDLDGDGAFDDATGVSPAVTFADNGSYPIALQVSDGTETRTGTAVVAVSNTPPVVIAGPEQSIVEGASISLAPATYADTGLTDTHTASIDWGDGITENGTLTAASSSGTVSGTHLYDDNGVFTVTVCVTDNDAATGCDTLLVSVDNSPPAVTLDTSDAVALPPAAASFFIRRLSTSRTYRATGADAGSDDLTFIWNWGDSDTPPQHTYFNNGSSADGRPPANRGATAPFSAIDTASHTYTAPGAYTLSVYLTDDDLADNGQLPTATIPTLITDDQDCNMTLGFWQHQFDPETNKPQVNASARQAYLSLLNQASNIFSERFPASTPADAWRLLQPEDTATTTIRGQAIKQTLAAWLNFAWGAMAWDETIPALSRPFHQVMVDIETVFLTASSVDTDYVWANDLAVAINEMDAKDKACKKR